FVQPNEPMDGAVADQFVPLAAGRRNSSGSLRPFGAKNGSTGVGNSRSADKSIDMFGVLKTAHELVARENGLIHCVSKPRDLLIGNPRGTGRLATVAVISRRVRRRQAASVQIRTQKRFL